MASDMNSGPPSIGPRDVQRAARKHRYSEASAARSLGVTEDTFRRLRNRYAKAARERLKKKGQVQGGMRRRILEEEPVIPAPPPLSRRYPESVPPLDLYGLSPSDPRREWFESRPPGLLPELEAEWWEPEETEEDFFYFNPGLGRGPEPVRTAERVFEADPTRENWEHLLAVSRRHGVPRFTEEGLRQACSIGEITSVSGFSRTPDGFKAEVLSARPPPRTLYYTVLIRDPYTHELLDADSEEWQWPWDGSVEVFWDTDAEAPTLQLKHKTQSMEPSRWGRPAPTLEKGEQDFTGWDVTNDREVEMAFRSSSWENVW